MALKLSEQEAWILGIEKRRGAPIAKTIVKRKKSKVSEGEQMMANAIRLHKIDGYQQEYRFHPERMWRFDFANPEKMIAVEVEGGVFSQGRHTRGKGFEDDCEKYNAAALMGWKVLRFSTGQVKSGMAINTVIKAEKGLI
jgi:very-short-patch-repair endonuclease